MAHEGQKLSGRSWVLGLSITDDIADALTLICEKETAFESAWDSISADSKCGNDEVLTFLKESISSSFFVIQGGTNVGTTEASLKKLDEWHRAKTKLFFWFGPAGTLAVGALRYHGSLHLKKLSPKADSAGMVEASLDCFVYADSTVLQVGT